MKKITHKFLLNGLRYKPPRLNADGTSAVYLRVGFEKKYKHIPTGINIKPANWDSKRQRVKKHNNAVKLNQILAKKEGKLQEYILRYLKNEIPADLDSIEKHMLGKGVTEDAHEFFEQILNLHTGKYNTIQKHRVFLGHLFDFSPYLPFGKINYSFVRDFYGYLLKQESKRGGGGKLSLNYAHNLMTVFKYYTKEARLAGYLRLDPFLGFTAKKTKKKKPHLTLGEVEMIAEIDLSSRKGDIPESRDVFVFSCYTGLRFSDLFTLQVKNIKKTKSGLIMVVDPIKTEGKSTKPVRINISKAFDGRPLDVVKPYLEGKKANECVFGPKNHKTHNKSYNDHLRVVQEEAGIEVNLSAHVGRHTCAMMLINEYGWDISKVKTYLGHSDIGTTQVYAEVTYRTIDEMF